MGDFRAERRVHSQQVACHQDGSETGELDLEERIGGEGLQLGYQFLRSE